MTHRFITVAPSRSLALCSAIFVFATIAGAQNFPLVSSAVVDYGNNTLTLSGSNFGSAPVVKLGSTALGVQSSSATQIVATFPSASPASRFAPGSYFLTVGFSNGRTAVFDVAMGATGPQGPMGPAGAAGPQGSAGPAGPAGPNTQAIALLKWYSARQGIAVTGLSVPEGLAFDGANIWVTNFGDGTVTKLRASDGANQATFQVGASPVGVTFDGANIWVANGGAEAVTKLRASDGANVDSFLVGGNPHGVAFDGANIWVTNGASNSLSKL
ncbi:MAG: hypothetical protein DMG06_27990 [Acidobacteria bacterium]|nr:MAG: hypothetical protein DMG06_27990 [Acidobacteriota bacterium]